MIGLLFRWVCPSSTVATRRRGPGLVGHRSWRPDTPPTTPITRARIREATIRALRDTKADPRSLRLTPGQRRHITGRR